MPNPVKTPIKTSVLCAIAACSMALTSGTELQLLPAGEFVAIDGRPAVVDGKETGLTGWRLDDDIAAALVARINARANDYVIDYEHGTLIAKTTGQPAPAAGWFSKVEWRSGVGLFATDVRWTDKARAMIDAGEYKYISPLIAYSKSTGAVTGLRMASITNDPAIDGMEAVALTALSALFDEDAALYDSSPTSIQESPMLEELLTRLRYFLNLSITATGEEIVGELDKLKSMINTGKSAEAAASCDLMQLIQDSQTQIAALSAQTPDPAQFVPIGIMRDLQAQLSAAQGQTKVNEVNDLVEAALSAGKLFPSQKDWAVSLGEKNIEELKAFITSAPVLAALSATQTAGKAPSTTIATAALSADQEALITALGVTKEQFQAERAKLGLS